MKELFSKEYDPTKLPGIEKLSPEQQAGKGKVKNKILSMDEAVNKLKQTEGEENEWDKKIAEAKAKAEAEAGVEELSPEDVVELTDEEIKNLPN